MDKETPKTKKMTIFVTKCIVVKKGRKKVKAYATMNDYLIDKRNVSLFSMH